MSISFSLQKKEVDIMYHGIQKKIVTDEWLIKETKVKAQNKELYLSYNNKNAKQYGDFDSMEEYMIYIAKYNHLS